MSQSLSGSAQYISLNIPEMGFLVNTDVKPFTHTLSYAQ
jgi:hypothetical protein